MEILSEDKIWVNCPEELKTDMEKHHPDDPIFGYGGLLTDHVRDAFARTGKIPKMPFYHLRDKHWNADAWNEPLYPSLFQIMTIAKAGNLEVEIRGYSPIHKRVMLLPTFSSFVWGCGMQKPENALTIVGEPDARVYKLSFKRRLFHKPKLVIYVNTDMIILPRNQYDKDRQTLETMDI